jgi:hypothetical protein
MIRGLLPAGVSGSVGLQWCHDLAERIVDQPRHLARP